MSLASNALRVPPLESVGESAAPAAAQPGFMSATIKFLADWSAALVLMVLTAPLVLLAYLAVRLTSSGPGFYSQVRLGRGGRPYRIYKLRSMTHNCEKKSGAVWSQAGDARVTLVGRFLRATHIDELPQLWNILKGDMSLVGPRPERPEFVPELEQALPCYRERLKVRPGLTGLAQVQLPPDSDLASVRRKLAHDLYYVDNQSFFLDFRILLSTAFKVLGLPFGVGKAVCRLPGGAPVEQAYEVKVLHMTILESITAQTPVVEGELQPQPA
jgi:lipopolysaccharide/colanic/teichoic acid biosynthesis glycosyltransferase